MKKLINFSMILVLAMVTGLSLSACSSSNSEVKEFITEIENLTSQIKKCKTIEEVQALDRDSKTTFEKFTKSEAPLTESDYEAIGEAIYDMTKATFGVTGQADVLPDYSAVKDEFTKKLSSYKTLGELTDAIMNGKVQ